MTTALYFYNCNLSSTLSITIWSQQCSVLSSTLCWAGVIGFDHHHHHHYQKSTLRLRGCNARCSCQHCVGPAGCRVSPKSRHPQICHTTMLSLNVPVYKSGFNVQTFVWFAPHGHTSWSLLLCTLWQSVSKSACGPRCCCEFIPSPPAVVSSRSTAGVETPRPGCH